MTVSYQGLGIESSCTLALDDMNTYSYDRTAGEGDLAKSVDSSVKWIERLQSLAEKARAELKKNKEPGRALSEFMGYMKSYRYEDWYEHFYG